jgi:hypothetical protein
MDLTKLPEAIKLQEEIDKLERQIKLWTGRHCFSECRIKDVSGDSVYVDARYIDFDVMKTLTLKKLQTELEAVKLKAEKL